MNDQDLLDLKKDIDNSKTKLSELKGQKHTQMEILERDFGCKTVKQAEKKLQQMKEKITDLEEEKEKGIKELEELYDFN